jgi:hypothetical protein
LLVGSNARVDTKTTLARSGIRKTETSGRPLNSLWKAGVGSGTAHKEYMVLLIILLYILFVITIIAHDTKRISNNFKRAYKLADLTAERLALIIACLIYGPAATILALGLSFGEQHIISGYIVCAMWLTAGLWVLFGYLLTESEAGNKPWDNAQ